MILTGQEIAYEVAENRIMITPFEPGQVNPNSYNYRLGGELFEVNSIPGDSQFHFHSEKVELTEGRWCLKKGKLYLGTTFERIGSVAHVVSLIGRSSMGRLGLFVQISANIGHQGTCHRWTLELRPSISIYLYPGQIIGQVSFWRVQGEPLVYEGHYGFSDDALESNLEDQ